MSKGHKLAIMTVIYPESLPYFQEFMACCYNQTIRAPLIIFSDGVKSSAIEDFLSYKEYPIIFNEMPLLDTIASKRIYALDYLMGYDYEWFLLLDSDDLMSKNRVEETLKFLDEPVDILYNPITKMDGSAYFSSPLPERLTLDHVQRENFVGLSAISIRKKTLCSAMRWLAKGSQCIAFDWFLICVMLKIGSQAMLISNCSTLYRIHGRNTAGDLGLTLQRYFRERAVKTAHYRIMCELFEDLCSIGLELVLFNSVSDTMLERYIEYINLRGDRFWWGFIDDQVRFNAFLMEENYDFQL